MSTATADLQKLYIAYFDRPADPAGLAYWQGLVANGQATLASVASAFGTAPEAIARTGGENIPQVLDGVYIALFGHHADIGGLAYWSSLVDQKVLTLSQAMSSISAGAQGGDLISLNAKAVYAAAFTDYINASPERIAAYTGADANLAASAALASVYDDASLAAALAQLANGGVGPIAVTLHPTGGALPAHQEAIVALIGAPAVLHDVPLA